MNNKLKELTKEELISLLEDYQEKEHKDRRKRRDLLVKCLSQRVRSKGHFLVNLIKFALWCTLLSWSLSRVSSHYSSQDWLAFASCSAIAIISLIRVIRSIQRIYWNVWSWFNPLLTPAEEVALLSDDQVKNDVENYFLVLVEQDVEIDE